MTVLGPFLNGLSALVPPIAGDSEGPRQAPCISANLAFNFRADGPLCPLHELTPCEGGIGIFFQALC